MQAIGVVGADVVVFVDDGVVHDAVFDVAYSETKRFGEVSQILVA